MKHFMARMNERFCKLTARRPWRRAGLVAALIWGAPQASSAADYFVATDGSDTNPGTESRPFKTIQRGVESATMPGDTLYIRGGTYGGGWQDRINPKHSGTADAPITYMAYPGELPILDGSSLDTGSGFEPTDVAVSHVRVIGIAAINWGTSGFSNGWNHPSSNLEIKHCIADNNGVNGIAFYKASNVRIEGNIVSHNGARPPSWSSGVNLYTAGGSNIIEGNVAFENIDVSDHRSDGSGFILDESSTHGRFVNNIAFRNGGSCIRLTLSAGGELINNTCIQNGQDANVDYNDEIFVSDQQSTQRTMLINNVAWPGKAAIGGQMISNAQNNVWLTNGSAFVSSTGALDFRLASGASQLIDQGSSSNAPERDVGFDPRCIKQQTGLAHWWQYAPDLEYIASIGGIPACFRPAARPAGAAHDVGAYELGATVGGCATDVECDDGNACTTDSCLASGQCSNLPTEGCCHSDADCDDADACTVDSCSGSGSVAGSCSNVVDPACGQNASGEWSYDSEYGYVSICNWGGFTWTHAGPETAGINGTLSAISQTSDLCYSGVVAAQDGSSGYAMLGININQVKGTDTPAENTPPEGDGLNISLTNTSGSPMRIQIQDDQGGTDASRRWCVEVSGSGGFYAWSDFDTECWGDGGVAYAGEPINVISVMVAGDAVEDRAFDFCLNRISPSGAMCVGAPSEGPGAGSTPEGNTPGSGVGEGTVPSATSGETPGVPAGSDGPSPVAPGSGMGPASSDGAPEGTADGTAVPGITPSSEGSSCACTAAGSERASLWSAAALLLGSLLFARRRKHH